MGELHRVLIKFWFRLWRESDSTHSLSSLGGSEEVEEGDFGKIGEMVREKFGELMQEKSLRTMREIEMYVSPSHFSTAVHRKGANGRRNEIVESWEVFRTRF